jgi:acyl-CoA dehydrogenase
MSIERTVFADEHEQYRDTVRRFLEKEVAPFHAAWEEQGYVDREVWLKAGENGLLCPTMPEQFGGAGGDKLYSVAMFEEIARQGYTGLGFGLHSEIVAPYILAYGTDAQKARLLPAMARGEIIGAIAMSEPAAGSDLQGIKTVAPKPSSPTGGMPIW